MVVLERVPVLPLLPCPLLAHRPQLIHQPPHRHLRLHLQHLPHLHHQGLLLLEAHGLSHLPALLPRLQQLALVALLVFFVPACGLCMAKVVKRLAMVAALVLPLPRNRKA